MFSFLIIMNKIGNFGSRDPFAAIWLSAGIFVLLYIVMSMLMITLAMFMGISCGPFGVASALYVGRWQMFRKMGIEGWKSIVPFYNTYCIMNKLYEDDGKHFWQLFIPIYNIFLYIRFYLDLGNAFGCTTWQKIGLIFMRLTFYPILGLSDMEYKNGEYGQKDEINTIFGSFNLQSNTIKESVKVCPKCGAPLKPNAKFCTKCGQEIV